MKYRVQKELLTAVVVMMAAATKIGATMSAANTLGRQSQASLSAVTSMCTQAVTVVRPLHHRPAPTPTTPCHITSPMSSLIIIIKLPIISTPTPPSPLLAFITIPVTIIIRVIDSPHKTYEVHSSHLHSGLHKI